MPKGASEEHELSNDEAELRDEIYDRCRKPGGAALEDPDENGVQQSLFHVALRRASPHVLIAVLARQPHSDGRDAVSAELQNRLTGKMMSAMSRFEKTAQGLMVVAIILAAASFGVGATSVWLELRRSGEPAAQPALTESVPHTFPTPESGESETQ